MSSSPLKHSAGYPYPLGASSTYNGINFALYCENAEEMSLCFFGLNKNPIEELLLSPTTNKTGRVWHICVHNLPEKFYYGYRITKTGHFQGVSSQYLVSDPYSKGLSDNNIWGKRPLQAFKSHDNATNLIGGASSFWLDDEFDWEEDHHPNIQWHELIIYEMHVRGFTNHISSKVQKPGTFLGITEKIPYLKELGVNAVELMPVFVFDECEYSRENPITKERLCNYWGYSPINFFTPMGKYVNGTDITSGSVEFKQMVKELHKNGIEVILDVVFNHTNNFNNYSPYLSFQGLGPHTYYILDEEGNHTNYSGCGNTFNANHPLSIELIIKALHYWVVEMHVDGFRFDLASILTRDRHGRPMAQPPIIEAMSFDPILSDVKLIAEPWDSAGLYQVGTFPTGRHWREWNDQYRDVIRLFIKGGSSNRNTFATRICGSEDLYHYRSPQHSINFVTVHDGFTLADLVSYNNKHNFNNGENNNDGTNKNDSWNCGFEGYTCNIKILELRQKQLRNFFLALFMSQGVPMIMMGDEYGHSRQGNNNAWCQDNELNWFLWDELENNQNLFQFVRSLITFRKQHSNLFNKTNFLSKRDINWHSIDGTMTKWNENHPFLAFTLRDTSYHHDLYIAFNPQNKAVSAKLPPRTDLQRWHRIIDTKLSPPHDFVTGHHSHPISVPYYRLDAFSAILLKAE